MGGAWDTSCDVLDACDPVSSRAAESCGFKEDAYVQEHTLLSNNTLIIVKKGKYM